MICEADSILFPFLKEAGHYARFSIEETLNDEQIIKKIDSYLYEIFDKKYHEYENIDVITAMKRFVGCCIVVNKIKKERLTHKFSEIEAGHYANRLKAIYNQDKSIKKENFFIYFDMIYRQVFDREKNDVKKLKDEPLYSLTVPRYLRSIGKTQDPQFKLINQCLVSGHVLFEVSTLFEIVRHGLARYLYNRISQMQLDLDLDYPKKGLKPSKFHLPIKPSPSFKELIKKYEYIDIHHSAYHTMPQNTDSYDTQKLIDNLAARKGNRLPPCILSVIRDFERGGSPSHFQRLTLCAFLNKKGHSMEQILEIFSKAPNYKEEVTRYQIEHIKNKDYMTPSCSSILNNCFCFKTKECRQIKNPLQF